MKVMKALPDTGPIVHVIQHPMQIITVLLFKQKKIKKNHPSSLASIKKSIIASLGLTRENNLRGYLLTCVSAIWCVSPLFPTHLNVCVCEWHHAGTHRRASGQRLVLSPQPQPPRQPPPLCSVGIRFPSSEAAICTKQSEITRRHVWTGLVPEAHSTYADCWINVLCV